MYRQLVHEITQTFQKISADIVNIIEILKQENRANIVVHCMEKVQQEEKKKLEVVSILILWTKIRFPFKYNSTNCEIEILVR